MPNKTKFVVNLATTIQIWMVVFKQAVDICTDINNETNGSTFEYGPLPVRALLVRIKYRTDSTDIDQELNRLVAMILVSL